MSVVHVTHTPTLPTTMRHFGDNQNPNVSTSLTFVHHTNTDMSTYLDRQLPRPRQPPAPGVMRMTDWVSVNEMELRRMMRFLQLRLTSAGSEQWGNWDWHGVRASLDRYVYLHSANRFLDFVMIK